MDAELERLRTDSAVLRGLIDAGEIDGARYMALELVDGVDLRSFIKSAPDETLSPDQVSLIALDLAYALEHAHATLVHRDISPSNILLSRSGEAKLADFAAALHGERGGLLHAVSADTGQETGATWPWVSAVDGTSAAPAARPVVRKLRRSISVLLDCGAKYRSRNGCRAWARPAGNCFISGMTC